MKYHLHIYLLFIFLTFLYIYLFLISIHYNFCDFIFAKDDLTAKLVFSSQTVLLLNDPTVYSLVVFWISLFNIESSIFAKCYIAFL